MSEKFLTSEDLLQRWCNRITSGTLANWRSRGVGPIWSYIGPRILYALADVEAWEAQQRAGTTRPAAGARR